MSKMTQIFASIAMAMQGARMFFYGGDGKRRKKEEPKVGVRYARPLTFLPAVEFYRHLWWKKNRNGRYELLCVYGTKRNPTRQWGRHTLRTFADLWELREYIKSEGL